MIARATMAEGRAVRAEDAVDVKLAALRVLITLAGKAPKMAPGTQDGIIAKMLAAGDSPQAMCVALGITSDQLAAALLRLAS